MPLIRMFYAKVCPHFSPQLFQMDCDVCYWKCHNVNSICSELFYICEMRETLAEVFNFCIIIAMYD